MKRTARAGRGQLDEACLIVELRVQVNDKADLLTVKTLRPFDVCNGNDHDHEFPVHVLTPFSAT